MPQVYGCAAIFNDCKSLKMKESENRVFRFPRSEKSRMDLFRASLSPGEAIYRVALLSIPHHARPADH